MPRSSPKYEKHRRTPYKSPKVAFKLASDRDLSPSIFASTYHSPASSPSSDLADDNDSAFHWEEEATLFDDLMEEAGRGETLDDTLEKMIVSLQEAFLERGKDVRKEIAQTLVPLHNYVKQIFRTLDDKVHVSQKQTIVQYAEACKEVEAAYIHQDAFLQAVKASQAKLEGMYEDLRNEYELRDALWVELQESLDAIFDPLVQQVADTPASIERVITKVEAQIKNTRK